MNTVTHLIVAAAALARKDAPARNRLVVLGALVPDLSMFVFFAWSQVSGLSFHETWDIAYWREPWQTLGAISNSVPLALGLLVLARWRQSAQLAVFSGAILLHLALDFPVHADDAHRHFWPLTDWRFASPVSYWDPDHGAHIGGALEMVIVLIAAFMLYRRFQSWALRGGVIAFAALQTVAAAYLVSAGGG